MQIKQNVPLCPGMDNEEGVCRAGRVPVRCAALLLAQPLISTPLSLPRLLTVLAAQARAKAKKAGGGGGGAVKPAAAKPAAPPKPKE